MNTEHRYNEQVEEMTIRGCRLIVLLAACLFPAFSVLDYFSQPDHFYELSVIRFSTTIFFALLTLWLLVRKRIFNRHPYAWSLLILGMAASSITLMCMVLTGYQSRYYAGVNLVILAAGLVYPWGLRRMATAVIMIVGIYALGVASQAGFSFSHPELFVNNLFFLSGTGIIAVVSAYFTDKLRRESFWRYVELEKAQDALKTASEVKSRFFANVSHELRTPLSLIMAPVRTLLTRNNLSDADTSYLQFIERNSRVLLKQVNDLLDLAKLDANSPEPCYSRVDLIQLVGRVCSCFTPVAQERGIAFEVNLNGSSETLMAEVDTEKTERILYNLLGNAFKFTPENGRVRCTLSQTLSGENEAALIQVSDSGPGIPAELREQVFERFFQIEESQTRKFGGTGLGLSIVKEYTELQNGQISIDQAGTNEGGARFTLSLPLRAPKGATVSETELESNARPESSIHPLPELEAVPAPIGIAPGIVGDQQQPLVLIVEDNYDMNAFIRSVLSRHYRVEAAFNGRDGLQKAIKVNPDLIISDVMMPEISGVDLLKEIRAHGELQSVPVLMLTAKSDDELRLELLRSGAQDFILKPFSPEELIARVSNFITLKRSRDILQAEIDTQHDTLEALATELARRNHNLQSLVGTLRTAKEEAEQALQLRDEFISIASHELKTPISVIDMSLQCAKLQCDNNESSSNSTSYFETFERTDRQLKKLVRLVDDLLDLTQIQSGQLSLQMDMLDLSSVVRDVVMLQKVQNTGCDLQFEGEDGLFVRADSLRIEQLVTNLITNAFRYGDEKPIIVKVLRSGESVHIQVTDHGVGIAKEDQKRIFERFERVNCRYTTKGLGLGLYIAAQIVNAHSGRIGVESEPGKGSTFTAEFPLHASGTFIPSQNHLEAGEG